MRTFLGCVAVLALALSSRSAAQSPVPQPLEVARILAGKYPAQPIMSYIPALSWSGGIRLSMMTKEPQWRERALAALQPFVSGQTPAIAEPFRLTSFAGALAFADAASLAGHGEAGALAQKVASFILPQKPDEVVRFATGWTDDMFMAASVLSRVENGKHSAIVGRLLTSYAARLQRPDGLFIHATDGPHAWGRGNGFALLGLTEALTHLPGDWPDRAKVLEIYRRHTKALAGFQSEDGSWRQIVDDPQSYRELTVTAMTVAAMARGLLRGWIDHATFGPVVNRGWAAVAARVNADGSVKDVCSGTGAQPAKAYYLNRPVINGADDRGGAMALLAAIELESMRRAPR
jgi:unsaturated rhamnogalacturonyl hydrolase